MADVTKQVIKDLKQRQTKGLIEYGEVLQTNNRRNALLDAYEEMLDGSLYLRQYLMEEKERREFLIDIRNRLDKVLSMQVTEFVLKGHGQVRYNRATEVEAIGREVTKIFQDLDTFIKVREYQEEIEEP